MSRIRFLGAKDTPIHQQRNGNSQLDQRKLIDSTLRKYHAEGTWIIHTPAMQRYPEFVTEIFAQLERVFPIPQRVGVG